MAGIEETIEELLRTRLHEEAVSIERVYFYKTDRGVDPRRESPFRYFPGTVPVLVSAPHAVRHVRQKKIKKSDEYTGALAYLLNRLTGCHSLAVTKVYGGDPNFDHPCIYKAHLGEICRQNKIKFVLDLHGAARDHEFDVDIGTCGGQSLLGKDRITQRMARHFSGAGLNRVSQNWFSAGGANTITRFVFRELGIPALQLEINRRYRVPAQNPRGFCRLVAALVAIIKDSAIISSKNP